MRSAYCRFGQTSSGFPRSALVRCSRVRRLLYPGVLVSQMRSAPHPFQRTKCCPLSLTRSHRLAQPSSDDVNLRGVIAGSLTFAFSAFPSPGGDGRLVPPWALSLASHHLLTSVAGSDWGLAMDTCQGRHPVTSHSSRATSCRTTLYWQIGTAQVASRVRPCLLEFLDGRDAATAICYTWYTPVRTPPRGTARFPYCVESPGSWDPA